MTLKYLVVRIAVVLCALLGVMSAFAVDVPTPIKTSKNSIFQPADFPSLGSLRITAGQKIVFDTGTITTGPTVSGAFEGIGAIGISQTGKVQLAVFSFDDINIEAGALVVVTGDRGLVLLSRDAIVINTTIDLSGTPGGGVIGKPGSGGPGGDGGEYGKTTASAPPPADGGDGGPGLKDNGRPARGFGAGFNQRVKGGTSGGGGAYGGAGGAASEGSSGWGGVRPMPGGTAYGDHLLTELFGGSGGAGGSNDRNFSSASGGGAGGALSLVALKSISFGAKAQILAKGGAGGVNRICGGGGSGGGILVAAPIFKLDEGAIVDASGGAGGDGGKAVYETLKPEMGANW